MFVSGCFLQQVVGGIGSFEERVWKDSGLFLENYSLLFFAAALKNYYTFQMK
jgi:hypothetical protein